MCQIFISADPQLYDSRARSVRLHGVATSLRLENFFWQVLEEIAGRDGLSVPQLCTRLYDELVQERGAVDNFTSFLRVCCGRYLALQLAGGIPADTRVAIRSLNPQAVLARERPRHAALQPRMQSGLRRRAGLPEHGQSVAL
ncbi:ribbon-helix-helix domain-containing protein [Comamonas sp. NLF-1-9]|uniref:ribbon-helix-helix domain-containing protein n=1 Tax=Comamonas sp. NLF-1-9 TaxID=2853163 RepID=UPI001C48A1FE|nr:ribbon-helix-helix domain-containing protein [Comamonas sp. NLF-1-9]QXL84138.1 ribbon-helix-helix domain-containing protein [Comamonas sp. NLF-1-9]